MYVCLLNVLFNLGAFTHPSFLSSSFKWTKTVMKYDLHYVCSTFKTDTRSRTIETVFINTNTFFKVICQWFPHDVHVRKHLVPRCKVSSVLLGKDHFPKRAGVCGEGLDGDSEVRRTTVLSLCPEWTMVWGKKWLKICFFFDVQVIKSVSDSVF